MLMECRKCESTDVELAKAKYKNDTYHIYLCCNNCFSRHNVPRDKEAYELTKDKPWLQGDQIKIHAKEWATKRKAMLKSFQQDRLFGDEML